MYALRSMPSTREPWKLGTSSCPSPAAAIAFFMSGCHSSGSRDGTPKLLEIEIGSSYRVSASTPSSSSALPGTRDPSAFFGCTASTFGKALQPHARERTVLYTAKSKPMRKAAVVNRSFSSGPAGMPNGRFTRKPRNSSAWSDDCDWVVCADCAEAPAAESPFITSANAPNGPCR